MSEIVNSQSTNEIVKPKRPPEVTTASEVAQDVIRAIYSAPQLLEQSEQNLTGTEALDKKFFLETTNLRNNPPEIVINSEDYKTPIQIPLDLVVDATGFTNWKGRSQNVTKTISTDEGYKTLPSLDVIKHYASKDRTTRPTIPEFDMFVQPDGKIFFANSNDGSHRLAAAIFNGEKTIPTLSIRVRHTEDNIF